MKTTPLWILAGCGLAAQVQAQDAGRHHFGVGLPVWLNAHARFSATRATDPGPNDGSAFRNRTYDDGFNLLDSTGNATPPGGAPSTANFGYVNRDLQVVQPTPGGVPPGPGSLSLHSSQINGGDYTSRLENRPLPGLEFFYRYDVKQGENWSLGLEGGAAYNYFKWEQGGAQNATVDLITDVFSLGGVTLPAASYNGQFTWSPGDKIIGSTPGRTQGTVPATVTGDRSLDLHALQFRLGPTLDWKPTPKWALGVQAGLALGVGFSQLDFAETITLTPPGTPAIAQSGSTSDTHFWAGLFSAFRINRQLTEKWSAHAEVRHMWTETLHHNGPLRSGAINLSDGLGVAAGLSYRF